WQDANMGELIRDHFAWSPRPWHERLTDTLTLAGVTPENMKAALVKMKMLREKQISLVADTMASLESSETRPENE
ncbi:MAG: hypothetical protein JW904_11895, partial [Spirochaetales bacterium]|nr:hypothetical protein [Spirochaetales bacterium]